MFRFVYGTGLLGPHDTGAEGEAEEEEEIRWTEHSADHCFTSAGTAGGAASGA